MTVVGDICGTTPSRRAVISLLSRLRSPAGQADPVPLWAELRNLGDVVPAPWGGFFVTGFDLCDEVLRSRQWLAPDFAWQERRPDAGRWHEPGIQELTRTLSRLNAPEHTRQRRALGNLFDRRTLDGLTAGITGHVSGVLDDLAERLDADGEAEFVTTVSEQLPVRTVGDWLGIERRHHDHVLDFTHRQALGHELTPTPNELKVAASATRDMRAFFPALIQDRRDHPRDGDDVLTRWVRIWDAEYPGDRAAADEILYDLTMFITIASLETTPTLLTNAVWLLFRDPARVARLRRDPDAVDDAVEEVLRYAPPIHLNSRVPEEDTVLAGVPIPRDTVVHIMYGAANHDPRRNPHPDVFDIGRRGTHLTFGGGAHYCLGAALARLEARCLLTGLLERFESLRPAGAPHYARRMVFQRATSLKVTR